MQINKLVDFRQAILHDKVTCPVDCHFEWQSHEKSLFRRVKISPRFARRNDRCTCPVDCHFEWQSHEKSLFHRVKISPRSARRNDRCTCHLVTCVKGKVCREDEQLSTFRLVKLTENSFQQNAQIWLVWATVAALVTMVARNPLYTLIVLLIARLVMLSCGRGQQQLRLPLWKLGGVMVVISAMVNGLFVHIGETVLWVLPAQLPLVGGKISLEAILFGANNGLTLWTLLVIFATFNEIVPAHALIRLIPSTFRDLSLVLLIAVTYVPATLEHGQRIREAQAIRGHELHGWRDWQPILIPLLIGGLERAIGLAEAMVARGYGATVDTTPSFGLRLGYLVGLLALLAGWFLAFWQGGSGWFLMGCALIFLLSLTWHLRSRQPETRYRPVVWQKQEGLFLVLWLILAGLVLFPAVWGIADTLFYTPYPRLTMPAFDPILGFAVTFLALPAWSKKEKQTA